MEKKDIVLFFADQIDNEVLELTYKNMGMNILSISNESKKHMLTFKKVPMRLQKEDINKKNVFLTKEETISFMVSEQKNKIKQQELELKESKLILKKLSEQHS